MKPLILGMLLSLGCAASSFTLTGPAQPTAYGLFLTLWPGQSSVVLTWDGPQTDFSAFVDTVPFDAGVGWNLTFSDGYSFTLGHGVTFTGLALPVRFARLIA